MLRSVELHATDALGQQDVPDYFQQSAKAIAKDVSVMRGPETVAWIQAVLEEIALLQKLGVYEEVFKDSATSTLLLAARKKDRIAICGNFQEVRP